MLKLSLVLGPHAILSGSHSNSLFPGDQVMLKVFRHFSVVSSNFGSLCGVRGDGLVRSQFIGYHLGTVV